MYSTDLTQAQESFIKRTTELSKRKTKYSIFQILDAIMYLVKVGCQWRNLPNEYPKWQLVYYYFRRWSALDEFQYLLCILDEQVRLNEGQSPVPSIGAIDSQSVKSALPQSEKGIDGNKKVKGIKRSIVTDKNGFVLAAQASKANIHDSRLAYSLLALLAVLHPEIKKIYADSGYRGKLAETVKHALGIDIEVVHSHYPSSGFVPAKKRWVVERTFAWLDNFRRLTRNYEQSTLSAQQMIYVAAIMMMLKRYTKFKSYF